MKLKIIKINLPVSYHITIILKNNNFYINIIDDKITFKIFLNKKEKIKISRFNNQIEIKNKNFLKIFFNLDNNIYNFFKQFNNYVFEKIKFKGKGYKIFFHKKSKIINFFFGRSHPTIVKYNNILIKKIKKYKIIFICNNKMKLISDTNKTKNIRYINHYTGRGLRKSRCYIIKRKGKQGSFI